ncbi:MAG: hypothetical protein Q8R13_02135 [bacterium]|nr:hypothetical protein [bacterium]MDZ4295909.1 hypothetical protein [Patescibacteria group bacterium]
MPKRKAKQINKTAKGNRVEDMAREILEKDGWMVEKKPNVRFASKDFWNRFDFICINHKGFKLIQVKTDRAKPRDREILRDFPCPKNTTKELWIYRTKTGEWLKEEITDKSKTTLA